MNRNTANRKTKEVSLSEQMPQQTIQGQLLIAEYKHSTEALAALEIFIFCKNIWLQPEPPIL